MLAQGLSCARGRKILYMRKKAKLPTSPITAGSWPSLPREQEFKWQLSILWQQFDADRSYCPKSARQLRRAGCGCLAAFRANVTASVPLVQPSVDGYAVVPVRDWLGTRKAFSLKLRANLAEFVQIEPEIV
jgi:hypothetical protein